MIADRVVLCVVGCYDGILSGKGRLSRYHGGDLLEHVGGLLLHLEGLRVCSCRDTCLRVHGLLRGE